MAREGSRSSLSSFREKSMDPEMTSNMFKEWSHFCVPGPRKGRSDSHVFCMIPLTIKLTNSMLKWLPNEVRKSEIMIICAVPVLEPFAEPFWSHVGIMLDSCWSNFGAVFE